jgi:ribosomal protein S18 acetylase RimI-like enzyme
MVDIRRAQTQDDAALAAIDAATWSVLSSPTPAGDPGSGFFLEGRRGPDDVLVAEADGVVAGYAMLRRSIPVPSHEHVLEVNGLAVDPAQQGRGIGRRLVEAAKQEASRRGARKLTLRVLAPNATARRLYESCGFVVEGVLVGEFLLDGELVDDVLMAWHVT